MQLIHRSGQTRRRQSGLSLVELMVGVTVSLFVVAAASLLMSTQITDNRRLLLETQVQQDLRATVDIITRELRRSSYWGAAYTGVPSPSGSNIAVNPMVGLSVASGTVNYKYRRASGVEAFGFRLTSGVIESCQGEAASLTGLCDGAWQQLTDPNTVNVTTFTVTQERSATANNDDALVLPCPNLCADGTTACWPRLLVREFLVTVTGQARNDAAVVRTLTSSVRVRNDRVDLSSEAAPGQACPVS